METGFGTTTGRTRNGRYKAPGKKRVHTPPTSSCWMDQRRYTTFSVVSGWTAAGSLPLRVERMSPTALIGASFSRRRTVACPWCCACRKCLKLLITSGLLRHVTLTVTLTQKPTVTEITRVQKLKSTLPRSQISTLFSFFFCDYNVGQSIDFHASPAARNVAFSGYSCLSITLCVVSGESDFLLVFMLISLGLEEVVTVLTAFQPRAATVVIVSCWAGDGCDEM